MCQPGRPRPQGEGQAVSSSSLWAFQSAKSWADSFSRSSASSSPWRISSSGRFESLP